MVLSRRQIERQTSSAKIVWMKKRDILTDKFKGDQKKTDALIAIKEEAMMDADKVKGAPYSLPVRRLDDVKAARQLDLAWRPKA